MIRVFVLSLTAAAVSAMVYEQELNLTTFVPKMRNSYSSPDCYKAENSVDNNNNGSSSACSCSQNAIVEWPWKHPQWWGVQLDSANPIVALRVYIRLPVPTCRDELDSCIGWAKIGMCKDKPTFMRANCSMSCGFCQKEYTAPTTCDDVNQTSCAWMAAREECERNPPYMLSKCMKSCNVCEPMFKKEFDSYHNSDFQKVNVYVGNTTEDIFTNMSANIMNFMTSGFTYFGTYEGPPANGETSVIIRRATDTSVTGKYVILTKNQTDGILALCEVQAWIHNPNNGTRMCIQNNTAEQQLLLTSANMNVPYPAGTCGSPETTIDGNITDTGCSCAQNAINGTANPNETYWWSASLANYSVIRGLHVWVRKEQPSCQDNDMACPGWAIIGMCLNESDSMRTKCPRSCGLCTSVPETSTSLCLNNNNSCESWKTSNECERNPPLMWKYCREKCRFCPGNSTYTSFFESVNATFMNITVLVGTGQMSPELLSQPNPSGLTVFTTLTTQVSDINPTVIRISLDREVEGDFVVIQKSQAKGPLAICEVRVLGEPISSFKPGDAEKCCQVSWQYCRCAVEVDVLSLQEQLSGQRVIPGITSIEFMSPTGGKLGFK